MIFPARTKRQPRVYLRFLVIVQSLSWQMILMWLNFLMIAMLCRTRLGTKIFTRIRESRNSFEVKKEVFPCSTCS